MPRESTPHFRAVESNAGELMSVESTTQNMPPRPKATSWLPRAAGLGGFSVGSGNCVMPCARIQAANAGPGTLPADAGFLAELPHAASANAQSPAADRTVILFIVCGLLIWR
jgi:hypothetical protein